MTAFRRDAALRRALPGWIVLAIPGISCGRTYLDGGGIDGLPTAAGSSGTAGATASPGSNGTSARGGSASAGDGFGASSGTGSSAGDSTGAAGGSSGGHAGDGEGGEAGSAEPLPPCDDGNPCTIDGFADGGCQHTASADGSHCDDGLSCTTGDRCRAGTCTPTQNLTGPVEVLGSVETYGTGMAIAFRETGFVFFDRVARGTKLTLTEVVSGKLETVGRIVVPGTTYAAAAWDELIAKVNDSDPTLELVSISGSGELARRGNLRLAPDAVIVPSARSMIGHGDRLWICVNVSFFGPSSGTVHLVDVSDLDRPTIRQQLPTGGGCGSLALSENGERLYVNTADGVKLLDLTGWDGTTPLAFRPDLVEPQDSGVSVRGNRLLLRTGERLRLLDERDHRELANFEVPGANSAALVDGGVYLQGVRPFDGGTEAFAALYDPFSSASPLSDQPIARVPYSYTGTPVRAVASGRYALHTYNKQVFEVTPAGLETINCPEVGAASSLYAAREAVHARSLYWAHRVDVSDPTRPRITAGGPHQNPLLGIKLDESLDPIDVVSDTLFDYYTFNADPRLVEVRALAGNANQLTLERVTVDRDEHYVSRGSVKLPGGDALLLSAGDFIYRLSRTPSSVRLQRWLRRAVLEAERAIPTPATDFVIDVSQTNATFDVDPRARRAAVAIGAQNPDNTLRGALYWLDLASDPPDVVEMAMFDDWPRAVRIHGTRVAYAAGSAIVFRELGSTAALRGDTGRYVESLLAFDGRVAYFSAYDLRAALLGAVLRPDSGPPLLVAELPMIAPPSSIVATDGALVAGSTTQIMTFKPFCQ